MLAVKLLRNISLYNYSLCLLQKSKVFSVLHYKELHKDFLHIYVIRTHRKYEFSSHYHLNYLFCFTKFYSLKCSHNGLYRSKSTHDSDIFYIKLNVKRKFFDIILCKICQNRALTSNDKVHCVSISVNKI